MKETNMEHFRSEIEDALQVWYDFGRVAGELVECRGRTCTSCEFSMDNNAIGEVCMGNKIKWLMSEYKEEPVLTEKEMRFMEFVQRGWLARDADGDLFWHGGKPEKNFDSWHNFEMKYSKVNSYDGEIFHFITWEDESPWSIEELRKLKVENAD